MLTQVQINGFRALVDIDVPLRPLTVLIGQNDTGKSSFLYALNYLVSLNMDLALADTRRFDHRNGVALAAWADGKGPYHKLIRSTKTGVASNPGPEMSSFLGRSRVFVLPSSGVATLCNGSGSRSVPELSESGDNLADVLDFFLRNDRKRFDQIETAVREHVPGVENLNIPTPGNANQRSIDLVIDRGLRIPADNASAGVRLMLFFITLAYHPIPPRLILIEEPENGVHPHRLGEIMKLLREITEGKHGSASQIVLTTHSPYLLDHVDPLTDQILVFTRRDDGARIAHPADAERLKGFLGEFMMGEVWFNQGEKGLVSKAG